MKVYFLCNLFSLFMCSRFWRQSARTGREVGFAQLVVGMAAVCTLVLSSVHYANGQAFNFRDFGRRDARSSRQLQRRQQQQSALDTSTFLHFLTNTKESLCRSVEGASSSRVAGGVSALPMQYNRRISRYCRDASIADQLVHTGLVNGYRMCQYMFKDERWNCSFAHQFLNSGFPQAGFVWAITVSKAVEELVMACRRGVPGLDCQCYRGNRREGGVGGAADYSEGPRRGRKRRPKRSLGASAAADKLKSLDPEKISEKYGQLSIPTCDDNIGHASRLVRRFFADNDKAAVAAMGYEQMVNFHNRRVGHLVVKKSQTQICHCLGISGSCTKKICIRGLQPYSRRIEANLHGLFQKSRLVIKPPRSPTPDSGGGGDRRRRRLLMTYDPDTGRTRRVKKRSLAYTLRPPGFCESNQPAGYHGVEGRQCNNSRSSDERGSCAHLCCGPYNYERSYIVQRDWCQCRMQYNPIRVDCQPCEKRLEVHRCRQVVQLYRPVLDP